MSGERAARRNLVRHLAQQGMSHRAIAAQVGTSKDTVRRDLAAATSGASGAPDTATAPGGIAARLRHADQAMRHLDQAAVLIADAQLPYVVADTATSRSWARQLRALADQLADIAEEIDAQLPTVCKEDRR